MIRTLVWGMLAMAQIDTAAVARRYVELLSTGKIAEAAAMHDAKMASVMPEAALKSTMDQVGTLRDCRAPEVQSPNLAVVNCALGPQRVLVKVGVDGEGRVAGLFFAPAPSEAAFTSAPYVKRDAFSDEKVAVNGNLPGLLSVPKGKGPFPAVVLLQGSGPHDLDETIGPNKPLRDLAEGLASKGIIALRFDKRTFKASANVRTVQDEVIDDAIAAIRMLQSRKDVTGVVVVGHSLGAYVAPRIAKQVPEVKALVLLAANVSPTEELVIAQADHLLKHGSPSDAERKALAELKASTTGNGPFLGAPASYWLDLKGYNPAVLAESLTQPILLVHGGRDYQVPTGEQQKWKAALKRKNIEYRVYPALNHLLIAGEGVSLPAEYLKPGHVDGTLIEDVAAFVAR